MSTAGNSTSSREHDVFFINNSTEQFEPFWDESRRFGREEICEGRNQPSSIHGQQAESRTQETGQLPPIQPSVIATAIMNTYTSTAQINLNQAVTTVTASRRFGRQEVCQEKWPRARRLGVCANSDNAQEGRTFVRVLNKRF